jgi:hypothetical protein
MNWYYQHYENDYTIKIYSVPFYPYQNSNDIHYRGRNHKIHKKHKASSGQRNCEKKSPILEVSQYLFPNLYYRVITIKAA